LGINNSYIYYVLTERRIASVLKIKQNIIAKMSLPLIIWKITLATEAFSVPTAAVTFLLAL